MLWKRFDDESMTKAAENMDVDNEGSALCHIYVLPPGDKVTMELRDFVL